MKQQLGVDRRLQKVQQELDTNVPVLEGTDVKAMLCFFLKNDGKWLNRLECNSVCAYKCTYYVIYMYIYIYIDIESIISQ